MRNFGHEFGLVDNSLLGLGSAIKVIKADPGEPEEDLFVAEWTGPQITAYQRSDSGIPVGATTVMLADALFIGVMGLGMGLGVALIKRLWTE